jgi:tRNA(Ile)-lysidine synthase
MMTDRVVVKAADEPICDTEAALLFNLELQSRSRVTVLAVSGGPDSTALLWLAARWRARMKYPTKLVAVTVDHGLRKESAREALAVKRLAKRLKVEHRTLRWTGRKPKTGIQEAARNARYRLLAEAASKAGATTIATAHTLDDQAETILFRMARGSGISGLRGIARLSTIPLGNAPSRDAWEGWQEGMQASINLVRPFLHIPKSRLIATLKAAGIPFADDPSNLDVRFARPRFRALMPKLASEGLDARRLDLLARRIAQVDDAIEHAVHEVRSKICSGEGPIVIDLDGLAGTSYEVGQRLLGSAIARVGDEGPVELAKLEDLFEAVLVNAGYPTVFRRTLAGAMVTLSGTKLTVERAPPRRTAAKTGTSARKVVFTKTR